MNTPDTSMDMMLNRWLLYQTYACRVMARTGFYQAGGAYGFEINSGCYGFGLLRACQNQRADTYSCSTSVLEGDVQHWWHPPYHGVRTRITDDLLFLPFVTCEYIERTGDWSILDELVGFIEDEPLKPEEYDRYSTPRVLMKRPVSTIIVFGQLKRR